MVTIVVIVLLISVAIIVGFVAMSGRGSVPVESAPDDFEDGVISEPVPISSGDFVRAADDERFYESPAAIHTGPFDEGVSALLKTDIGWAKQFEPRSGALSNDARLGLINDLGMLRMPWCEALLVRAAEEETEPAHRAAARLALARCRDSHRA
jgi:hypothetical protein